MTDAKTLWVAIIGAGPAGYYTAETLAKYKDVSVHVDIMDKLPTPYGLIRAGVAPDHQSIKNVSKRYEATNSQKNVRFVGNIAIGKDVSLAELMELYDAVVLATGAPADRQLSIKGEDAEGVIGSGAFVGWYNSHPDYTTLNPNLNIPAVAIIGNGNVAIDVARVLAKTASEMATSDLAKHAASPIHSASIKDIYMLGRRGPLDASFTPKELGELNQLENAVTLMDPKDYPADKDIPDDIKGAVKKNLTVLKAMTHNKAGDKPVTIHLNFYQQPQAILKDADGKVSAIQVERTRVTNGKAEGTGDMQEISAQMVIPCIGYKTNPIENVPYDTAKGCFKNKEGLIAERLYCVGWARRGPTGTIGTNKPDGIEIAQRILKDLKPSNRLGRVGLEKIIKKRKLPIVTFQDWKKIEAAEEAAASGDAPRVKFADIGEMIKVID